MPDTINPAAQAIQKPIAPIGKGADNISHAVEESYRVIMDGLTPEYQGFVENPDQ